MKKVVKIIAMLLCMALILGCVISITGCEEKNKGGDGIYLCRKCGEPVYQNGLCYKCWAKLAEALKDDK